MAHLKFATHRVHVVTSITFIVVMLQAATVFAQLEEVIVTAERREASIQEVPVAVSAYTEADIERLQVEDTLDLINVVPNLVGGNNTGLGTANMYFLRAQGNDESIATFDPPVGTYVDNVYVTRQNANNFALFDVERIEVLRGPQGTLFGRNTSGGAISVIMKKPTEEPSGFAEVGFGRYNEYLARASVNIPFSETVLSKLSAFIVKNDGFLENAVDGNTYNDKDDKGFRGALRFLLSDSMTWDLSISYIESKDAYIASLSDDWVSNSILPSGLPDGFGWVQKSDYGNDSDTTSVVSNLSWDVAGGSAEFIVGYRDLEQSYLLNFPGAGSDDFFWIDQNGDFEMLTAELKWNASLFENRLNLVTGAFYMNEDNNSDWADYLFTFLRLADRVMDNTTDSWAIYAQGDISVGEKGTLTIGARYTDEKKDIDFFDNTGGNLNTAGILAAGIPIKQTESKVTPRLAYAYQFNDEVMGYASVTNGFKSGGWNARGTSPAALEPFGPETVWSYELGMRAEWLGGRLRTNATFFYTDLKDLQTAAGTESGQFLTTNSGGMEVPGFELELTALPTDNWQVFFALGLQDADYVDLPEGCTVPNSDYAAFDIDCNVADPKRAPKETFTLSTSYDFPISDSGAILRPTASVRYIGDNVAATRQNGVNDAVYQVNAALSLISKDKTWVASVECKNCFDEEYITSFLFVPYYTPPRTWQARLRYNFSR